MYKGTVWKVLYVYSVLLAAIKQHSPDKPVLVFVSSRRQTRLTALDLMGFVVVESDPKQWLKMPDHEVNKFKSCIITYRNDFNHYIHMYMVHSLLKFINKSTFL